MGKRRDTSSKRAALPVRLTADDRTAAPLDGRHRRWAEAREDSGDDRGHASRTLRGSGRSGGAGAHRAKADIGFRLTRLIYWGTVLALWSVIGLTGLFAWVAFHLPPIESLEIPKRPPTIEISTSVMMALPTMTNGLRARSDRFGGGGTCSGSSAARGLLGEMGGLSLIDAT